MASNVISQTFEDGKQVSCDRVKLKNLDMNNITGDFHADGPGRVISVRRGGGQTFGMPGGPLAGEGPASARVRGSSRRFHTCPAGRRSRSNDLPGPAFHEIAHRQQEP